VFAFGKGSSWEDETKTKSGLMAPRRPQKRRKLNHPSADSEAFAQWWRVERKGLHHALSGRGDDIAVIKFMTRQESEHDERG
jgi:hypothetical protein